MLCIQSCVPTWLIICYHSNATVWIFILFNYICRHSLHIWCCFRCFSQQDVCERITDGLTHFIIWKLASVTHWCGFRVICPPRAYIFMFFFYSPSLCVWFSTGLFSPHIRSKMFYNFWFFYYSFCQNFFLYILFPVFLQLSISFFILASSKALLSLSHSAPFIFSEQAPLYASRLDVKRFQSMLHDSG